MKNNEGETTVDRRQLMTCADMTMALIYEFYADIVDHDDV
jgi:hypothetical protein